MTMLAAISLASAISYGTLTNGTIRTAPSWVFEPYQARMVARIPEGVPGTQGFHYTVTTNEVRRLRRVNNPTEAQYNSNGWFRVEYETLRPTNEVGRVAVRDGYVMSNNVIYATWRLIDIQPEVRRYSKYYLILAAKEAGKWDAVKQIITAGGYDDLWQACNDIATNDQFFQAFIQAVKDNGICTDDELRGILDRSVELATAAGVN